MPRRLLLTILCAAALLSHARAAEQWIEVRSPHFSVVTDAGERRGREVALRFEQMRAVFGTLILRSKVSLPVPLQIVAFKNSGGLRPYVPLWKGRPVELAGFYQPGEDRSFIAVDLSANEGFRIVFHEYAHLLLDGNYPRTQPWFDEGFAEYYSTIEIRNKEVEIGRPPSSAPLLVEGSLPPVATLFAVTHDSKIYNESGDRRTLFYAQSWLVVHYLFDTAKLKETAAYFDLVLNQHLPVAEAIPRAFGMDPKQFDRQLIDYAHSNRLVSHSFEAPAGIDDAGYAVTKLDPADAQAVLADLHLHSPDHAPQAMREFEQVLQLVPNHAAAHRGLGYAYLRQRQFEPAAEHLRRAAEVDPTDARVHYDLALLMQLTGRVDDPWTMKKEAEKAIALAPEFADAYNLLAAANAAEGDLPAALQAMRNAIRLSPRSDLYLLNLAQYSLRAQKWDDAEAIFERVKTSPDPGLAALAAQNLERIPGMRANPPPLVARRERPTDWSQYDDPQWRRSTPPPPAPAAPEAPPAAPDKRPVKFLKGTLLEVECAQPAVALLTVLSGKKTWKLRVADTRALVLVGARTFSCDWRGRQVAINYREGGQADGDLVSLELD
jgi:Flp pilus assembly protein TadD